MRHNFRAIALLAIAAPLASIAAQQQQSSADALPTGWSRVYDTHTGKESTKFVTMGPGLHVTSNGNGAGIYYEAKDAQPNQPYSVMANFRQTAKITGHGEHGEAFGLFAAGKNLDDPTKQTYYYFLVRQDGQFLINHRAGTEVHKLVDWTSNAAIHKFDDMPNAKNDLAINVGSDSVRFLVNSTQVHAISRKDAPDMSGDAGIRVNHMLDVHVANFMVMKGGK